MAQPILPVSAQSEINGLYVALYDVPATQAGFVYWLNVLEAYDPSITSATSSISTADAQYLGQQMTANAPVVNGTTYFATLYPSSITDVQFVEDLYQNTAGFNGTGAGIQYWVTQLQALEATNGNNVITAREAIAGQFVQAFLQNNLSLGAAAWGLSQSDYNALLAGQQELLNKIDVSEYWAVNSSADNGLLNYTAADLSPPSGPFAAGQTLINSITSNSNSVSAADSAINSALSQNSLTPITSVTTQPVTITLTTGVDSVVATQNNTTVVGTANGAGATFTPGDSINGNGFSNVALTVADLSTGGTWTPTSLGGVTVSGVQTVNLQSGEAVNANTVSSTQGYSGLTTLNVNSGDGAANVDTITVAATTAVNVTDNTTAAVTANLTVNGGSTVAITEANNAFANGGHAITVKGGTGTTSVSVTQTETTANSGDDQQVAITDTNYAATGETKAGVIANVTLNGLDNDLAIINSNAVTNLSVSNSASDDLALVKIHQGSGVVGPATLDVSLNDDGSLIFGPGTIEIGASATGGAASYTTLAVSTGAASSFVVWEPGLSAVTSETITGSSTLSQFDTGLTGLATVSIGGGAGLIDPYLIGLANLISVTDTSGGNVTLELNDQQTTFSGASGIGAEIVYIVSDATEAITGNGDNNSEIVFANTASIFTAANTGINVTGFKVLGISGDGTFAIGTSPFAGPYTAIDDIGFNSATITGVTAGTPLSIDNSTDSLRYNTSDTSGLSDSIAVTLGVPVDGLNGQAPTSLGIIVNFLTLSDSLGKGIGTVSFTTNDSGIDQTMAIGVLADNELSSLSDAGPDALVIGANLDKTSSLNITDNHTGAAVSGINFLTDSNLASLTFSGSGNEGGIGVLSIGSQPFFNITNTNTSFATSGAVIIFTLNDANLTTLNLAGASQTSIGAISNDISTLLTIVNNDSSSTASAIVNFTDVSLNTLQFSGSGATTISLLTSSSMGLTVLDSSSATEEITFLNDSALASETYQNTGSAVLTIAGHAGPNLSNLTLLGNVAYTSTVDNALTSVSGSTDNAAVSLQVGTTDAGPITVALGNGNNTVDSATNADTAASIAVTAGNGNNMIESGAIAANLTATVGSGNNTISGQSMASGHVAATVGAGVNVINLSVQAGHTGVDTVTFSAANGGSLTSFTTINSAFDNGSHTQITFANVAVSSLINIEGTVGSIAAGVANANLSDGYNMFQVAGNTWVYEYAGSAAASELVQVTGVHTFTASDTLTLMLAS